MKDKQIPHLLEILISESRLASEGVHYGHRCGCPFSKIVWVMTRSIKLTLNKDFLKTHLFSQEG